MSGRVVLVGAGPGDPDLLTIRAEREIRRAEVLLYDALIPDAIIDLAPPNCERIDVGKRGDGTRGVSQGEIAKRMLEKARGGGYVVRLKGGDPFVFGRGAEEAGALVEAGIPFEVVPGISSAMAVPAYAGIPLTDRRASSSVAIVTGHRARSRDINPADWEGLARSAETLIVLMGTAWVDEIVARVMEGGRDPDTPSAVISRGTMGSQRVVRSPLCALPDAVRESGVESPSVIVIGEVARFHSELSWYEQRPLFGLRVLILRAHEQRADLVARLAAAGATPVCVSLLAFEPSPRREPAPVDWVVFTSANALPFVSSSELGRARVACVGENTARAARSAGFPVHLVPAGPAGAESLAAALGEIDLRGARILLPQARGAPAMLADALAEHGALVERHDAYRNVVPEGAEARVREVIEEGIDAVMLTSPSTVERLERALSGDAIAQLANCSRLVCIGATTRDALHERGISRCTVAREASSEGLVSALERQVQEESHAFSD